MRNTVRELYPAPYPIWEVLLLDKKYLGTNSANRLIKKIGNLLNLKTNNKDDIVSAINEIADGTEVLITVEDIDTICGATISYIDLNEGTF